MGTGSAALGPIYRRHRESVVEKTFPRTRHMNDGTIEYGPAICVPIQSFIEKMMDETPRLGDPENERPIDPPGHGISGIAIAEK